MNCRSGDLLGSDDLSCHKLQVAWEKTRRCRTVGLGTWGQQLWLLDLGRCHVCLHFDQPRYEHQDLETGSELSLYR